jgi:3-methyl-2-oxobutanoate hydroxymethyltransferase
MIEMVIHTQAVSRAVKKALVVSDMPFGSFQKSDDEAVSCAIDLVKAGAEAVKVEGASHLGAIKKIIKAGIPVMGHLGFTPQAVNLLGYKKQGRTQNSKLKMIRDAKALQKAGCFLLVLELVDPSLAKKISKMLKIPVVGIGSGSACDGQVLVTYDLLGLYPNPPKFVQPKLLLRTVIAKVIRSFISGING